MRIRQFFSVTKCWRTFIFILMAGKFLVPNFGACYLILTKWNWWYLPLGKVFAILKFQLKRQVLKKRMIGGLQGDLKFYLHSAAYCCLLIIFYYFVLDIEFLFYSIFNLMMLLVHIKLYYFNRWYYL